MNIARFLFAWTGVAALAIVAPVAAQAQSQGNDQGRRVQITPHIDAGQVLTADLTSGDVLTYSTVGAGVDVSAHTRRVEVQIDYQYEHQFSWNKNVGDADIHTGLARVGVQVSPGFSVDAGAIATRARSDIRGADPSVLTGNPDNISQVYSAYIAPSLATRVGPGSLTASYRAGYTKVEAPGTTGVPAGQPLLDRYDHSVSQLALASYGVRAGALLPVGITVSGAWQREDASQLGQRYDGKYVRGDLVLPVSRELAVVGGAGYEKIQISQRDPKRDVNGDPVVDADGRYVTDPNSPRRYAYQTKEPIYWDAGILWRPSPRTMLEARVGRRYDSWSYTGSFSHQIGPGSGVQVGVYDSVQSFGRQLSDGLAALPTSFDTTQDTFSDNYNGCVFGSAGNAPGGCLNGIFQSVATSNYRARGVNAIIALNRGPNRIGAGFGYANRRFFAPDTGVGYTIEGVTDESYYAQVFASRALDYRSTLSGNLYLNYFRSGIANAPGVLGAGATGIYSRSFGRLGATLAAGVYSFKQESSASDVSAQALLGLGYQF